MRSLSMMQPGKSMGKGMGHVVWGVVVGLCVCISINAQPSSSLMSVETAGTGFTVKDANGDVLLTSTVDANRTFEFVNDGVLKVNMEGNSSEQFADNGEDYYGGPMHPRGEPWEDFSRQQLNNRGFTSVGDNPWSGAAARAPYVMSTGGWAIWAPVAYNLNYQNGFSFTSYQEGDKFYYIIYGPGYREMFQRYRDVAGAPLMPPLWAFGLFGWYDESSDEKDYETMKRAIEQRIPATAYWADNPAVWYKETWWSNYLGTYGPEALVDSANAMGYRFLVWTSPFIKGDTWWLQQYMSGCGDLQNQTCLDKLDTYLKQNVGLESYNIQGFKIDREADNYEFGYRFWEQSAQSCIEVHGDDWFIFSRGLNDQYRQFSALWNGDSNGRIEGYKLTHVHMLRAGAIMFPMCGPDVGGYNAGRVWSDLDKESKCRQMAHGAYCPFMETPDGLGWHQDQTYNEEARQFCREHHMLMPYNRSMMYQAHLTGFPVMCAMEFMFPDDDRFSDEWKQNMFGPEILCRPVYEDGVREVEVLVPEGEWVNYHNRNQAVSGKSTITIGAPMDIMPQLIRAGAIIPKGDIYQGNQQWITDWQPQMCIEFFPSSDLAQAREFPYYTGDAVVPITCGMSGSDVSISFDDLQVGASGSDGVLRVYCASYNGTVTDGGGQPVSDVRTSDTLGGTMVEVPFDGATDITITGVSDVFSGSGIAPGRPFDRHGTAHPGTELQPRPSRYCIFDMNGRCFARTPSRKEFTRIRRQLPRGVYLIQHVYPQQVHSRKISVTR